MLTTTGNSKWRGKKGSLAMGTKTQRDGKKRFQHPVPQESEWKQPVAVIYGEPEEMSTASQCIETRATDGKPFAPELKTSHCICMPNCPTLPMNVHSCYAN